MVGSILRQSLLILTYLVSISNKTQILRVLDVVECKLDRAYRKACQHLRVHPPLQPCLACCVKIQMNNSESCSLYCMKTYSKTVPWPVQWMMFETRGGLCGRIVMMLKVDCLTAVMMPSFWDRS